ncbi:MAG: murein L,D-transpeptidase YafK [Paracoccaceae bacterium]
MQKGRSLFVIILALGAGSLSVKRISTSGNAQGLDLPVDDYASGPKRFSAVKAKVTPHLKKSFQEKGLTWGSPIFIRAFKEEKTLELWVKKGQEFTLFRTYPIAAASGKLGPKQSEGDRQVPEGFYFVKPHQMNPQSNFHLSFNIGYPNAFDKAHNRSGSFIMIHGSNVSLGCLAMTNARIEEIYTLAKAAFKSGQPFFRVHFFPFHMTAEKLARHTTNSWLPFWKNLKTGYQWFEEKKSPPNVTLKIQKYHFE